MAKRIVPFIVLATVLAYAGWRYTQRAHNGDQLLTGVIEATQVTLSAEINGRVVELGAAEGDAVEAGRVLARIDTAVLEAQLKQADAARLAASGQYKAVDAGIKNLDVNVRRGKNLYSAGSISEQSLDSVTTEKDVMSAQRTAALGQIRQAEAAADLVKTQIDKATVAAPIAGTVLRRDVELGETALPGSPLFTLADLARPWVRVYIPETDLGRVKIGQSVKVYSDSYPGKVYAGAVTTISGEAEFTPKNVQTKEERVRLVYAVKVALENPDGELKIGMPVDADLGLGE